MTEIPTKTNPPKINPTEQEYPVGDLPTFYADAVLHFVPGKNVIKIIFNRQDPSFQKLDQYRIEPCVQVIMPIVGYIGAFPILEHGLKTLIDHKIISEEEINNARKLIQTLIQASKSQGS